MTFAKPVFLYGLILIPTIFLFVLWANRRRETALARLGNLNLMRRLSATVNRRGRHWRNWLWFLALAMLILALARPQWGSTVQEVEQEGIQVMVALDVSQSMLAEDIKPNRLSRAKMEIAELMQRLGGDEIGLVLFAGDSFVQFPLTSDYSTARSFLDNAGPHIISKQGTAIGDAIRTAMTGFDPKRTSQKVIILITDGEDHESDAMAAAQEAVDQGAMIYTIGFGSTEGEPIPVYNNADEITGYKKDINGEVVLSRLDEATLQEVAQIGHGKYYPATVDGSELSALITELSTLQKDTLASQFEMRGIERFQVFLLFALAALAAAELIPDRLVKHASSKKMSAGPQVWQTSK